MTKSTNPTIAQSLDQRASRTATPNARQTGVVVAIEPSTYTLHVNTSGQSGPRRVIVPLNLRASFDQVKIGSTVVIERLDDSANGSNYIATEFFARHFLPLVGNGVGSAKPNTFIAAPTNFRIIQIGTQMQARWDPVHGAVGYKILSNTSPSPNGATALPGMPIQTSTHTWVLDAGPLSELLTGGGFESGDFTDWENVATPGWNSQVVTSQSHSGIYSMLLYFATTMRNKTPVKIIAGNVYTVSLWLLVTSHNPNFHSKSQFKIYDASGTLISTTLINEANAVQAWTKHSITVTAPANSDSGYIEMYTYGDVIHGWIESYYDDCSVMGQSTIQSTSLAYSVVAIGAQGQTSQFSNWAVPSQQSAALGSPAVDHLQLSPTGQIISSVSGSPPLVAMSPRGMTTTGWEVPLDLANPPAWQVWTRVSDTSFTVPGDVSANYTIDTRLRWVQNSTTKYGRVTANATYSAGTGLTTVLITGDVLTSGQAITAPYYSYHYRPQLYPDALMPSTGSASFTAKMIMLWDDIIANIPTGWAECDGTSGRANIRGRTVIGMVASGTRAGTVGTALTDLQDITHTHTGTSHQHVTTVAVTNDGVGASPTGYVIASASVYGLLQASRATSYAGLNTITGTYDWAKTSADGTGNTGSNSAAAHLPFIQLPFIEKT